MIRKILPYILILIALVGLFGPVSIIQAAEITNFYSNPSRTTSGKNIILRGNSRASICNISGGNISKDSNGNWPVFETPHGSYTTLVTNNDTVPVDIIFTLTCMDLIVNPLDLPNLPVVSLTTKVTVDPVGITPIVNLQGPSSPIPQGTTSIKLSWTTTNVKEGSCVASSTNGIWSGPKSNTDGKGEDPAVQVSDGSIYTLTCDGIGVSGTKGFGKYTANTVASGLGPPQTLGEYVNVKGCGFGTALTGGTETSIYPGCFITITYGLFYVIPSSLLWLSAYIFNVLISVTLHSNLFTNSAFIPKAWGVVRDLSNLFFILILLYIALKIILDLGRGEAKKMIAKVIVIALLINFSMFFTSIVIDSSNILALIFYNKMEVNTKNADGSTRQYDSVTGEPDVAGGMVNAFDPTKLLNADFFENGGDLKVIAGAPPIKGTVSTGLLIGITIVAGSLMLFASYAFLWAGIAFLSRMIQLFALIIFSPFAFMSSSIPLLGSIEYLGWESWFKRLLKTSFMAPIFMFFMYFIFMLISTKPSLFDSLIVKSANPSVIEKILLVVIPALVILFLLIQATEFAKKGSGKIGEVIMTGVKMAGGLALGAVTGGTALLATKTIGGLAAGQLASKGETWRKQAEEGGLGGLMARMKLKTANYGSKATFDIGKAPGIGSLTKKAGLDLQSARILGLQSREGGFKGATERRAEELKKESELYKTTKSDAEVAAIAKAKLAEYEERKQKAKEDWGHNPDNNLEHPEEFEKEYEKNNGKPPVFPQTANELNNERMKAFRDNVLVGSHGLLGSLAYQYRKTMDQIVDNKNYETDEGYKKQFIKKHGNKPVTYDTAVANEVNRGRIEKTKMIVGAYTAKSSSSRTGEAKFSKDLEKGMGKMSKVTDRMAENTKAITELKDFISKGNDLIKDEGKPVTLLKGDGSVDTEKIEDQLARLLTIEKHSDMELRTLAEKGHRKGDPSEQGRRMTELFNEGIDNIKMVGKLNKLKNAPKDLHKLNTENLKFADRQHALEEADKPKEDKKDHGTTKAEDTKAPAHGGSGSSSTSATSSTSHTPPASSEEGTSHPTPPAH